MGPGFKYHVVTIVAIFLALTVGLVVGNMISPQARNSLEKGIKNLQTTVNKVNVENTQEIDRYRKFVDASMPVLLNGKLDGQSVAIIQTGDYPDELQGISETINMAGAHIVSVTVIEKMLERPDEVLNPALANLHAEDPRIPADRAGLFQLIASTITQGDTETNGIMPALEKAGFVSLDSDNSYQVPPHYVVVLAGSRIEGTNRPANVDQPLIQALQKLSIPVVMCEPEKAAASDVPVYHTLGVQDVATVDNIDSDIGKVSLIYALLGAKDDYGVKPAVGGGTKNLMPPFSTPTH